MSSAARAAGLLLGTLADQVVPDPQKHHPVAWFGTGAMYVEAVSWDDNRPAGVVHVAACLAPLAVLGVAAERLGRRHPVAEVALVALTTWAVTGGAALRREGETVVCVLPGQEREIDEFNCDRELIEAGGQWVIQSL